MRERIADHRIVRADFEDPQLTVFLQAHLDDMEPTAPPQSRHALDLTELRAPSVRLWTTYLGEVLVATGALVPVGVPGEVGEELKSMRTDPAWRGRGLGRSMLEHLIEDASSRAVPQLWLETGSMEFFAPAHALYAQAGFVRCPPFGDYHEDPLSLFMTRACP